MNLINLHQNLNLISGIKKVIAPVLFISIIAGCTSNSTGTTNVLPSTAPAVDNIKVTALITQKCAYCHSAKPNAASGYNVAPSGIILDTQNDLTKNARRIKNEVLSKSMPLNPITMTDDERAMIGQWADQQ